MRGLFGGKDMKKPLLLCTGLSGSGKTYFIKNTLPDGLFYSLRSATTRPMRVGESNGNPYFFVTEDEFEKMNLAIISKCGKRRRDELGELSLEERLSSARSNYDVSKTKNY